MYDLRIVVEEVRGFCDMPMRPGDYCELRGSRLSIPDGRYFCMWALQSVLPLLPVKQRRIAEENDWIPRTFRVTCPDPDGMVILRIEQLDARDRSPVDQPGARGDSAVEPPAPTGRTLVEQPDARQWTPAEGNERGPLPRMLVNSRMCSGCRSCELACSYRHEGVFAPSLSRITVRKDEVGGVDEPVVCRQCGVARCVQVCPCGALARNPRTGAVRVDAGLCMRCGDCVAACPFGAIRIHPDTALPLICDLCDGDPACVGRCATGALRYGRAGDLRHAAATGPGVAGEATAGRRGDGGAAECEAGGQVK